MASASPSIRYTAGSSLGMVARSSRMPSCFSMRANDLESTVSIPRPRRSTLKMPSAFRSSFSHWTTVRSFIEAFSTGTTSASSPWVMTKPPTWIDRWRGKPSSICGQGERPLHAGVLGAQAGLGHVRVGERARPRQLGVLRQPVHLVQRQPERLAHLADGEPAPVADDLAHHARRGRGRACS